MEIGSETSLVAVAAGLCGPARLTAAENRLVLQAGTASHELVEATRDLMIQGMDPLGDAFLRLRTGEARRPLGQFYTPHHVVRAMVEWARTEDGTVAQVVDPGCGSGQFLAEAARVFPEAKLVGIEVDPLAVLMTRARGRVLGWSKRLTLLTKDYREVELPAVEGRRLFIGNPPYVRHHDIGMPWKAWYGATAAKLGFKASKLAGLHLHFFMRTREIARPGDIGAFITASEWMDTNYGSTLREMLANGLGGTSVHVIAPEAHPFEGAMTTGAVTCFRVGNRPDQLIMRNVERAEDLGSLDQGRRVPWTEATPSARWSILVREGVPRPAGMIELGELFRAHRGTVTGANAAWLEGAHNQGLPKRFFLPTVTKALDLISAGEILADPARLRRVLYLPNNLSGLSITERNAIDRFLRWARQHEVDQGYVASHRRAWWSVELREPPSILCTYMARRAPAFVLNKAKARYINIAHGLYPREPMPEKVMLDVVRWLRSNVCVSGGRTYAGGLTKFEPRELERLLIPPLNRLHEEAYKMVHGAAGEGRSGVGRELQA